MKYREMTQGTLQGWSINSVANSGGMQLGEMGYRMEAGKAKDRPLSGSSATAMPEARLYWVYDGFQEAVTNWLAENKIVNSSWHPLSANSSLSTVVKWGEAKGKRLMMHNFAGAHPPMPAEGMEGDRLNEFVQAYIEGTQTPMNEVVRFALADTNDRIRSHCRRVGKVAALLHVIGWELYFEDIDDGEE